MTAAFEPLVAAPARAAVLVDFDGTLSPIVANPDAAVPLPAARDALAGLVGAVGLVAVVSGRPVAFLRAALGIEGITYVGQYGLERWVGARVVTDPRVEPFLPVVADVAAEAERELPGLRVERKQGVAVVLHWREQPERGPEAEAWAAAAARRSGLELHPAKMAAELRPPVPMDKGRAVAEVCTGAGVDGALFAGDDAGDLAAFDALDRLRGDGTLAAAVRVAVRSPEAPPDLVARADVVVDGPAGLAALLRDLGAALTRSRHADPS
jgi:trehalose 6-phosphate phosphatase